MRICLELPDGHYVRLIGLLALIDTCNEMLDDTESDETIERRDDAALSVAEIVRDSASNEMDRAIRRQVAQRLENEVLR